MEDRNKRKRPNIGDAPNKMQYNVQAETACAQVTYDSSLFGLQQQQQPVYLNQLQVVQNSQLVYQVENAADGTHQNVIYVVVPENVTVPGVSSLPLQKDPIEENLPLVEITDVTDGNKGQNSAFVKSYLKNETATEYEQKALQPLQYSIQINQAETTETEDKNEDGRASWRTHAYRCDYRLCSKSFSSVYEKKTHMESHYFQESTEFKCNLCGMVFDKAVARNKHVETHSVPNNHTCRHCGKSFPYYTSLTRHIEQKQCTAATKLCSCQHCGSKFVDANDLNKHIEVNLRVCKCNAMICGEDAYQIHLNLCATCKNKNAVARGARAAKKNQKNT